MNIRHRLLQAIALLLAIPAATAAELTPEEALARLSTSGPRHVAGIASATPDLVATTRCADGEAAVYVFDKAGDGYLIVSADDSTTPLLGYSDSGSLDGTVPPQLQWWLGEYARQIEYNKAHGLTAPPRRSADGREEILPMIKTDWDQGAPYNEQCPTSGTERTYTGCVATAMAQVMNYWQYPERGKGQISYNATTLQKRLSLNLALKPFDWDNMLDIYLDGQYNADQAAAVAYLMKACGYAVKMDYGLDSSGALAMNISNALVKYFDYDPNIRYTLRQYYSTSEWNKLIYDNLKEVGPVLYGGGSMIGGGHSFICDGYDGNGYFHFNWGWTGMSNGYFSLDALNPYALGAGGGAGGGYNFTQDAVLGIRPPTGEPAVTETPVLTQTGSLAGYIKDGDLFFDLFASTDAMWVNYTPETLYIDFGARFHNESDPSAEDFVLSVSDRTFKLATGYGTAPNLFSPKINLADAALADGRYKVTIVNSHEATPDEWLPVLVNKGYFNYIYLTKSGDKYTVENNDVDRLGVVSGSIESDFYFGTAVKVSITVANDSDEELSSGFAPCAFYKNEPVLLGESIYLTVAPHQTETREWVTTMYSLSQYFNPGEDITVQFTFFDEMTYNFYTDDLFADMTLKPNTGAPDIITAGAPKVVNATRKVESVGGKLTGVYYIEDKRDIQVTCDIKLNSGYFAYPMYACVATTQGGANIALETYNGDVAIISEPGEKYAFSTSVPFPEAVAGKTYMLMMGYGFGSNFMQIGPDYSYFVVPTSGVGNISTESPEIRFDGHTVGADGCLVEIFSLQGIKVAEGSDSVGTAGLAPGVYIVRAGDRTRKISL